MDMINDHFFNKVILLIVLAFAGVVVVVFRKISTNLSRKSASNMLQAAKLNPTLAKELITSLDIPYAIKQDFPALSFTKLKSYLTATRHMGNFSIQGTIDFDPDTIIVFTEINYGDFDVSYLGEATDVKKKAYHQFVLKHNPEKNVLKVLSTIYNDTTAKFQKEGFINAVFNGKQV